jgi:EAL domain-containing protein (putative c-di-GMP-specific phosphodiesterase class I)
MASIGKSRTGMRNQSSIADLIVKGAIALVTAAFFIGAYLQFQVTFWLALIAALSVYITLLMLHTLMRRSQRVDALASEVTRLENELATAKGGTGEYVPPMRRGQAAGRAAPPGAPPSPRLDTKAPLGRADTLTPPPPPPLGGVEPPSLGPVRQAPPPVPPAFSAPAPEPLAPPSDLSPNLPPWPSTSGDPEPMHDYWSFRPERETPDARRKDAAASEGARETDLEAVQGMIKRLASEVSLGDGAADANRSNQDNVVRASVDALYSTADTMRAASKKPAPARRDRGAPPAAMPPPIAPSHARLSSVAEAIAARRMDVCLEPIVGLADHRLHHYEVIVLPRDEKGGALALAGHDRQLSRTGLLPLIDAARLKWAARMSGSFAEKGQKHCVFSAASAESLTADRFLDELANAYRQRETLAADLVLMFSLADVKAFSGVEWSALTDMRDLGFRFGLMEVGDLDYEFTALRAAGFAFVKLDAAGILKGLPGPRGLMPAADTCRYMSELGLTVIVDQIGDEQTRAGIREAGVPLAQGPLFGPPVTVDQGSIRAGNAAA